jgi:alcohol dehydrogenase class IV
MPKIESMTLNKFVERFKESVGSYTLVFLSHGSDCRLGLSNFMEKKQWISEISPNPTIENISKALAKLNGSVEKIIAVGGGSTIDTAKAIIAFFGMLNVDCSIADLTDAIEKKLYSNNNFRIKKFIAVPTTSGTGSEVTHWATVWDNHKKIKYSVDAEWLMPTDVWLVPELTVSLSARLTLSTGLDAFAQACEAYWARRSDSLARALAVQAVTVIREYLPLAFKDGKSLEAREEMQAASLLAGLAFSRTGTTACHSISYPITALFGVEHGFAVALTLVQVARRNKEAVDCGKLLDAVGSLEDMRSWLDRLCADIQPLRLGAFGICADDIPLIVKRAFTTGRMDNNPVIFTEADVANILSEAI